MRSTPLPPHKFNVEVSGEVCLFVPGPYQHCMLGSEGAGGSAFVAVFRVMECAVFVAQFIPSPCVKSRRSSGRAHTIAIASTFTITMRRM